MISYDICLSLTYFTQYDSLYVYPCCYKWHYFALFYDWGEVSFLMLSLPISKKRNVGPSVLQKHFITLNSTNVSLKREKKSFPTLFFPNILSIVKHFSVEVRTLCLKQGPTKSGGMNSYFILVLFPASLPVNFLCLECWWEMLFCFCLQQFCCFDFVWVVWKTVRHLEWVFCLPAIWPLHIYFSYLLHDDKGTKKAQFSSWIFSFQFNNSEKRKQG